MRSIFPIFLSISMLLSSCASLFPFSKIAPEYQGVDPKAKSLVDEYLWLSAQNHISFKHIVTVGFKKMGTDNAVGLCTYGPDWHEIDIDSDFWNRHDSSERLALIFHELTHCYCNRDHDWGSGIMYLDTEKERIAEAEEWQITGGLKPGRFDDGCPYSLMYPIVVDSDCLLGHYSEYISEMFNRCRPY